MDNKSKMIVMLLLVLCSLTQGVFGDIVGPPSFGANTNGRLLIIAPIILVIWLVCASIIKAVRNKNVDK